MELSSVISKLKSVGLKIVFFKTIKKLIKPVLINKKRKILSKATSFSSLPEWFKDSPFSFFHNIIVLTNDKLLSFDKQCIDKILNHSFDLLGDSNLNVNYEEFNSNIDLIEFVNQGDKINSANKGSSIKILRMIDTNYKPINWQCDFKSSYCWKSNQISDDISYGNVDNVDIKVPWELARFNDFTYLVLHHILTREENQKKQIEFEFRSRILDFIAMNPPNFGVNWINAMEVGIRAVNWLVSYDIIRQSGAKFDNEFKKVFYSSIYSHFRFIIENLEWSSGMRGNHYFANIVSLLIISAYLPVCEETTATLLFCLEEFIQEFFYQFNEDGSNFEASTYYHCFVLELILYALYFVLKLPTEKIKALSFIRPNKIKVGVRTKSLNFNQLKLYSEAIDFDKEFWKRLLKILEFTDLIILKDGSTINIGDMDSGRFLKFSVTNYLWQKDLINQILDEKIDNNDSGKFIECSILSNVINKIILVANNLKINLKESRKRLISFNDFGLYIINNPAFQIFFRCGSIGQKGKGGHAHNDQLSIILLMYDFPVFIDSGTYIYTGNHKMRNKFRSTEMHNTLSIQGLEQNQWNDGKKDDLFWLRDTSKAKIIKITDNEFEGIHYGFGKLTTRKIKISDNIIYGQDLNEVNFEKTVAFHLNPLITDIKQTDKQTVELSFNHSKLQIYSVEGELKIEESFCSPEYGKIIKNKTIMISCSKPKIEWKITMNKI